MTVLTIALLFLVVPVCVWTRTNAAAAIVPLRNCVALLLIGSAHAFAQTPRNASPAQNETAAAKTRITELEREVDALKTRLIDCLSRAPAERRADDPRDAQYREALAAVKSIEASLAGSFADFRRYYLDAKAKVDGLSGTGTREATLREIMRLYDAAHESMSLAGGRPGTVGVEKGLEWTRQARSELATFLSEERVDNETRASPQAVPVAGSAPQSKAQAPTARDVLRSIAVFDPKTEFAWLMPGPTEATAQPTMSAAKSYCETLSVKGISGWTLPSIMLLRSVCRTGSTDRIRLPIALEGAQAAWMDEEGTSVFDFSTCGPTKMSAGAPVCLCVVYAPSTVVRGNE